MNAKPVCYTPSQVIEFSQCRSKRRFKTNAEAQAANKGHRPYQCRYCEGWHLTSKPLRGK